MPRPYLETCIEGLATRGLAGPKRNLGRAMSSASLGRCLAKEPSSRPRDSTQTYGERARVKDPAASSVSRGQGPRRPRRRGAPGRNRTCDLALRRRTLYPLSYRRARRSLPAVKLSYRTATVHLSEPFTISRSTSVEEDVLQVEIEHDGTSGFGEAQPQEEYGETAESAG